MRYVILAGVGFALLASPTSASNLLTNGDFEQPLTVGWQEDVRHLAGTESFDRWDSLGQPVPGHAARVYKYLAYHASLYQVADVPNVNVTLAFDGRFQIAGGSSTCWPTGAVIVSYQDVAGDELGCTMILLRNQYNSWVESDTMHFHDVGNPGEWERYEFDVAQEIEDYLPGVTAADVRKVKVQLFSYCNGT